jgi:hypothetical protein
MVWAVAEAEATRRRLVIAYGCDVDSALATPGGRAATGLLALVRPDLAHAAAAGLPPAVGPPTTSGGQVDARSTDDHHRAQAVVENALGGRPQRQVLEAATPAGAHDHQLCVV